ncbi:MAG: energy transducer TonB [Campylobacterales bacterium]
MNAWQQWFRANPRATGWLLSLLVHAIIVAFVVITAPKKIAQPSLSREGVALDLSNLSFELPSIEPMQPKTPVVKSPLQPHPSPQPIPSLPTTPHQEKPNQEPSLPPPAPQTQQTPSPAEALLPQPKPEPPLSPPPKKRSSALLSALNEQMKERAQLEAPIEKLYGEEFSHYTKEQQEFIKDHLQTIGSITQRYLRYPYGAGELGMEGVNVVEFDLLPNGDIERLRLLDSSGYTLLDKNSLETIRKAYKDYPRPHQKTTIRIYVNYRIIR